MKVSKQYLNQIIKEEIANVMDSMSEAPLEPATTAKASSMKSTPITGLGTIVRNLAAVGLTSAVMTVGSMVGSRLSKNQQAALDSQSEKQLIDALDQQTAAMLEKLPTSDLELKKAKVFYAKFAQLGIDIPSLGFKFGSYIKARKQDNPKFQTINREQLTIIGLVSFYEIAQALKQAPRVAVLGNAVISSIAGSVSAIDAALLRMDLLEKSQEYINSLEVR